MATIALTYAGTAAAGPVGGIVGAMLGSYIDQNLTYPLLFGKRSTKPEALEGFQLSTTDAGAPRWEVFGIRSWVPCHYLWTEDVREEHGGGNGQTGKGGRPFVQQLRVNVGVGICDGPIVEVDTLFADENPVWSRQFNRVVLEDHRWTITADIPNSQLRIEATDADVADFAGVFSGGSPVITDDGDVVRLDRVTPVGLQGFWRVAGVAPHSGTTRSVIALRPLQGQSLVSGTAGSALEPAAIRRIDQGVASSDFQVSTLAGGQVRLARPDTSTSIHQPFGEEAKRWVVGGIYRFVGWNPGRWKLVSFSFGGVPGSVPATLGWWIWEPQAGTVTSDPAPTGTSTLPLIIYRDEGGDFVFDDSQQEATEYLGTLTQSADPALSLTRTSPPAHRGIAHLSLKNWNLGPQGNVFPRLTASVRARTGETVAAAIDRIVLRAAPVGSSDTSALRAKALTGFSVPGGMASGQALQPLMLFYGIVAQERGGVLTFLDERDVPVVAVATRHLNARPSDQAPRGVGFEATRIPTEDVAHRVLIDYVDPANGANATEGDGIRSPGSPSGSTRDTLPLNAKPLVVYGYEVKRRTREVRRRLQVETHGGVVRLPANYLDVLPGTCLTFRSNNRETEYAPATSTIAFFTTIRDLLPNTVRAHVRFSGGQVATLADNGAGSFAGFPSGITASVNSIDYTTGHLQLLCSQALDTSFPPIISYQYEKLWLVRARRATPAVGHDFSVTCEVVRTLTDNPLPPVPRDLPTGFGSAIASSSSLYRTDVLDIPSLWPGMLRTPWFGIVAAPEPGATWRGAIVYQSPNGTDRWVPIGQIQAATTMGSVVTFDLPDSLTGLNPSVVDWTNELTIDLPNGETLDNATTEQIANGVNWCLVGNEIMAFHEAVQDDATNWKLRGIVRCMRHTILDADTHADGERFILLTGLGLHGLIHEPASGFASTNATYFLRVVPGGSSIDNVPTISAYVRGRSVIPAPPQVTSSMIVQRGTDLYLTWARRAIDQTTVFGPSPLQAGEIERYRVVAFDIATAATLLGSMSLEDAIAATAKQVWHVGDGDQGTAYVYREIRYKQADFTAHGFVVGVTPIGFVVYQVGRGGISDRSDVVFATPV